VFAEYDPEIAQTLYKIEFPAGGTPDGIKLLWLDSLSSTDIESKINRDVHAHTFFEIHFIIDGCARYEICGKACEICGSKALFLPPMVPHRLLSCDSKFVRSTVLFSVCEKQNGAFYGKPSRIIDIPDEVFDSFKFIMNKCRRPDTFTPSMIAGRTIEIIHSVLPSLDIELAPMLSDGRDPRVLAAIRFIENNRHRMISCDDVARECCLSGKQLGRIFRRTVGVSLYEYIADTKLRYAVHLLSVSRLSVKETAFMLGYDSESCFAAFFKRRTGVSPGSYGQMNQSDRMK